jgi:2-dehydropantoate 2-reductase
MMKTFAVLGVGAIGGYCAVRLAHAGFPVHCLLRSDFSFVKEHGLTIVSSKETIHVKVNAYKEMSAMPLCDVILIALKTTQNHLLKQILPSIMHSKTIVVVLQNGIGMEQQLAEYIDDQKIIGGICNLKVSKESPGTIRHLGHNFIQLAQYYSDETMQGITHVIEELCQNFQQAGIQCTARAHLPTLRWEKLASNIPLSGLSTVLDASIQELVTNTASFSLLCALTQEVITAAERCGAPLPPGFFQFRLKILKSFIGMEKSYPSMKEDFDARRPLELKAIYENTVNIAKAHHYQMPLTEMLFQQLCYLEDKNKDH